MGFLYYPSVKDFYTFDWPVKAGSVGYLSNARVPTNYTAIEELRWTWTTLQTLTVSVATCAVVCEEEGCHGFTMFQETCSIKVLDGEPTAVMYLK